MRTIDIHAHWYPAEWLKLFEKDGPKEGAKLERTPEGYTIRTERITNTFDEKFVDLAMRLEGMRRQGVDVHALSLTAPMVYWASPGLGLALSQAYNDAASAAHLRHPGRFIGLAMLPMQAPDLALKELERCARLPGMRGMYLATNINGGDLDDRRYWDIYAKAEELGWPVFLHPVDTIGHDDRINANLVRLVGADRVVLGSDYCFDMGLADPVATVERLDCLSQEEKNLIKGKTAARLLRLI